MTDITLKRVLPERDQQAADLVQHRLDQLTKPRGSLGYLETVVVQLAAMTGQPLPTIKQPVVVVVAADHGVTVEGVSAYPSAVTTQMVTNYLNGGAAINVLAAHVGAKVRIVDAGVAALLPEHPLLIHAKQGWGSANLRREPAMTIDQTMAAIEAGAALVRREAQQGMDLLAVGEMGIGNTTAAACLTCVFTGASVEQATGRGAGLDSAGVLHKQQVVSEALARAQVNAEQPLLALAELGGFEIALLVGAMVEAACQRIPVLLDGYITTAAALVANAWLPGLATFLIASHQSAEPGHRLALATLGLRPLLQLDLRLGEGTGAALALPLLTAALRCLQQMATFTQAGVSDRQA